MNESFSPTVINLEGKVIAFGAERFLSDVLGGGCCCICGEKRDDKPFNDEHVIPDWLQRAAKLHAQKITLPNGTPFPYGQYKVPCCVDCNSLYGKELEERVAAHTSSGYEKFIQGIDSTSRERLFVWLSWIFFKTHYKDTKLAMYRDKRKGDTRIADYYEKDFLHHVHAISRSVFAGTKLGRGCIGSLMWFRVDSGDVQDLFDYRDFNHLNTGLIVFNDIALLYCLDDAGMCMPYLGSRLVAIGENPLSPLQLREMLAHLSYLRHTLVELPKFSTHYDVETQSAAIVAEVPAKPELREYDRELYGRFLYLSLQQLIERSDLNKPEIVSRIQSGDANFILDEGGDFMKNGTPRSVKNR